MITAKTSLVTSGELQKENTHFQINPELTVIESVHRL